MAVDLPACDGPRRERRSRAYRRNGVTPPATASHQLKTLLHLAHSDSAAALSRSSRSGSGAASTERSHGNVPVASVESQRWASPPGRGTEANFIWAAFRKRIPRRDALVAIAGPDRWHLSRRLAARPTDDPERRIVVLP
jgi:hypothetical protein